MERFLRRAAVEPHVADNDILQQFRREGDAGERAAFARRARAHVAASFTRDAMCARTIDVYEELLFPEPATARGTKCPG